MVLFLTLASSTLLHASFNGSTEGIRRYYVSNAPFPMQLFFRSMFINFVYFLPIGTVDGTTQPKDYFTGKESKKLTCCLYTFCRIISSLYDISLK